MDWQEGWGRGEVGIGGVAHGPKHPSIEVGEKEKENKENISSYVHIK